MLKCKVKFIEMFGHYVKAIYLHIGSVVDNCQLDFLASSIILSKVTFWAAHNSSPLGMI